MLVNLVVLVPYKHRSNIMWRVTLKVVMKAPAIVCAAFHMEAFSAELL